MKFIKILFFFLSLFTLLNLKAQSDNKDAQSKIYERDPDFDNYGVDPEFPGGLQEMYKFLSQQIVYPTEAIDNNIQGKVYVQFIVERNGRITEVTVVKGVHKVLDSEAVRVISSMPKWKPGKYNGKVVRVRYTIPINFTLSDDENKK